MFRYKIVSTSNSSVATTNPFENSAGARSANSLPVNIEK